MIMNAFAIQQFSFQGAVGKLWEKLGGGMDSLILKLPNLVLAIIVTVIFYFLGKYFSRFCCKYLFNKIEQGSIKDLSTRFVFGFAIPIGFLLSTVS